MEETILVGRGKRLQLEPLSQLKAGLAKAPGFFSSRLRFMSRDHHRIRNMAVSRLPRSGFAPLSPSDISRALRIGEERVVQCLDDLERNLLFLVRNGEGCVTWAFPVTVDETPHRLLFRTGEGAFAA